MPTQIRLASAWARERAWTARGGLTGAEPPGSRAAGRLRDHVVIDLDATPVTAHPGKQDVRGTSKAASDIIPSGRAWTTPRPGAGDGAAVGERWEQPAVDHLTVLEQAPTQIPDRWRSAKILIRADGAGYAHASALSSQYLALSVGYPVTEAVRDAIGPVRTWVLHSANNSDGGVRKQVDVVEVTHLLQLSRWASTSPGCA